MLSPLKSPTLAAYLLLPQSLSAGCAEGGVSRGGSLPLVQTLHGYFLFHTHRLNQKTPTYHCITSDLHFWGVSQGWMSLHRRQLKANSTWNYEANNNTTALGNDCEAHKYSLLIPDSTYLLTQISEMPTASPKPWTLEKCKAGEVGVKIDVIYPLHFKKNLIFGNITKIYNHMNMC